MNAIDLAWATGLYEGEGSVGIYGTGSGKTRRTEMSLGMTDLDVVKRFHSIVDIGCIVHKKRRKGWKDIWRWQAGRREEILALLLAMKPMMGDRRKRQAEVVIREMEALLDAKQKKEEEVSPPCGFESAKPTQTGLKRHKQKGEPPCESCRELARSYWREWSRSYRKALAKD